jgi:hypothetical protein
MRLDKYLTTPAAGKLSLVMNRNGGGGIDL